jgi:hypothetical protein
VCVLGAVFGVDSRQLDDRQRPNWR